MTRNPVRAGSWQFVISVHLKSRRGGDGWWCIWMLLMAVNSMTYLSDQKPAVVLVLLVPTLLL
jgi:hypothetical protein